MSDWLEHLETLVAACEAEFTSEATEATDEHGEHFEPDNSEVTAPSSHITFGMIRNARFALEAVKQHG